MAPTLITITCLQEQSMMDIGVLALLAQGDWSGGRSRPCCDSHHSCWPLGITFCCLFFFLMKISRNGGLRCNWVIIPSSLFLDPKRTVCQQVGALSCVMYMCNILFPKPELSCISYVSSSGVKTVFAIFKPSCWAMNMLQGAEFTIILSNLFRKYFFGSLLLCWMMLIQHSLSISSPG